MNDDLVRRLNGLAAVEGKPTAGALKEAADRIEKLEAALREIAEDAEDEFASAKDMGWIARKALDAE
jgi:uncharacterized protein (UPF0335 family)